jgi:predicted nucleic acid-binding protein
VKIVVDTNIVFSALITPKSVISDILLNSQDTFKFYSPDFIHAELQKHKFKLMVMSGLREQDLDILFEIVLRRIEVISWEAISSAAWERAFELLTGLDEFDAPFVVLAVDLNAVLWTGDKKLMNGLKSKSIDFAWETSQAIKLRNKTEGSHEA